MFDKWRKKYDEMVAELTPQVETATWGEVAQAMPDRPSTWAEFQGNESAKELLRMSVDVAQTTGKPIRNTLLYGYPGTGKTTLANIVAAESGSTLMLRLGSSLKNETEIIKMMMEIEDRQNSGEKVLLFIDEIHNLGGSSLSEDQFFYILEEGHFPHNMRGSKIKVNGNKYEIISSDFIPPQRFPIIGATTDVNLLHPALQSRFEIQVAVEPYTVEELSSIVTNYCQKKSIVILPESATKIASISRFVPRRAIAISKIAQDYAIAREDGTIRPTAVSYVQKLQGLNDNGLTKREITLLQILASRDKPMGAASLAASAGMSDGEYRLISEPFLVHPRIRFIVITARGRMITDKGKEEVAKYEND